MNRREQMISAVRRYFDACNAADAALFREVLSDDCIHWFPPGTGGPYIGRDAIVRLWADFVRTQGSVWSIDRLVCDSDHVVIEWTHFKPKSAEHIRGSEWYEFDDDGRINAIWAHYASPRDPHRAANELEGFDYAGRGYRTGPPELDEQQLAARAQLGNGAD